MRVRVFSGSYSDGLGFSTPGLDEFCDGVEVVSIGTHFFDYAGIPRIAVVVTYRVPQRIARPERETSGRDWREDLDSESKHVYDALRVWRNDLARESGRAAYVLLTNRQLAELAKQKPRNLDAVRQVPGVGENRAEELGPSIVRIVQRMDSASSGSSTPKRPPTDTTAPTGGVHDD